ncbi:MAG: hypothetical protein KBD96_04960 [Brachymonas sp.]|jgi:hypothetical protein|nr:hypothetical protein [Brachymonas sp.]MBP6138468.1 hypothetical protein [Brachymonas sp.]MBP7247485.1 hypothetical protein [Brachymonas sp.]MBP7740290.1 hypothetical protein [Brachymonas sp.]MBP8596988.1 hypothetical protein [Brachymonas sp.]
MNGLSPDNQITSDVRLGRKRKNQNALTQINHRELIRQQPITARRLVVCHALCASGMAVWCVFEINFFSIFPNVV